MNKKLDVAVEFLQGTQSHEKTPWSCHIKSPENVQQSPGLSKHLCRGVPSGHPKPLEVDSVRNQPTPDGISLAMCKLSVVKAYEFEEVNAGVATAAQKR